MKRLVNLALLLLILCSSLLTITGAQARTTAVRAVLFFSPTCPHCHTVIENVLPPLQNQYNEQLVVLQIDVSTESGFYLYQEAITHFSIPDERLGVPTLIVGDQVLVGSLEIPEKFPGLIEKGLAAGGIEWPALPGLSEIVPEEPPSEPSKPLFIVAFLQDPLANSIAVIVLLGMLASVIGVSAIFVQDKDSKLTQWPKWALPLLAVIGLGVAMYLSFVEVTKTEAVCGPVGNCNAVQQSPYAILLGFLPVGVLGVMGYIALLSAWLIQQYGPKSLNKLSSLAMWAMAWFGILFSIYLTFLEPFVIGATCAWCVTSAIVMTLIFWISTGPAKQALGSKNYPDDDPEDEVLKDEDGNE